MSFMTDGDQRCRPVCSQDLRDPPRPDRLNEPADDSECPAGTVCAYKGFVFAAPDMNVCVTPCDPGDPTTCLAGTVCRYLECVDRSLAAACTDGSGCADGQICDETSGAVTCLSPVEFDQLHPRPPRSAP